MLEHSNKAGEWLKSKTQMTHVGKDVEQQKLSRSVVVGMQNGAATLEDRKKN